MNFYIKGIINYVIQSNDKEFVEYLSKNSLSKFNGEEMEFITPRLFLDHWENWDSRSYHETITLLFYKNPIYPHIKVTIFYINQPFIKVFPRTFAGDEHPGAMASYGFLRDIKTIDKNELRRFLQNSLKYHFIFIPKKDEN